MIDYYDLLELAKDADGGAIKRAYFSQVRKYPPEQFPEKFKQIREAYETLSDSAKKTQYDIIHSMPQLAGKLLLQAQEEFRRGYADDAINTLKPAIKKFPRIPALREELAQIYDCLEKTGNAISTWEQLYAIDPDNPEYMLKLADAYNERGWWKKALDLNATLLKLQPTNGEAWGQLLRFYHKKGNKSETAAVTLRALKADNEYGLENITVYAFGFIRRLEETDEQGAELFLKAIVRLMRGYLPQRLTECDNAFNLLLDSILDRQKIKMFPYLKELADILAQFQPELPMLVGEAELILEIKMIVDEGYHDVYHDIFINRKEDCDCEECRSDMLSMESAILIDIDMHRKQIRRLKEEHPRLYELHSSFFREVLICRDPEPLIHKRMNKLSKMGYMPSYFDYNGGEELPGSQITQTVQRIEPKVGRNDPCPCGSGKKYKRCCGA